MGIGLTRRRAVAFLGLAAPGGALSLAANGSYTVNLTGKDAAGNTLSTTAKYKVK